MQEALGARSFGSKKLQKRKALEANTFRSDKLQKQEALQARSKMLQKQDALGSRNFSSAVKHHELEPLSKLRIWNLQEQGALGGKKIKIQIKVAILEIRVIYRLDQGKVKTEKLLLINPMFCLMIVTSKGSIFSKPLDDLNHLSRIWPKIFAKI